MQDQAFVHVRHNLDGGFHTHPIGIGIFEVGDHLGVGFVDLLSHIIRKTIHHLHLQCTEGTLDGRRPVELLRFDLLRLERIGKDIRANIYGMNVFTQQFHCTSRSSFMARIRAASAEASSLLCITITPAFSKRFFCAS